jgi:hypothetical protein
MTNISIQLGSDGPILGLTVSIPLRLAEDDVTSAESDLEAKLLGALSMPNANALLRVIRGNILSESTGAPAVKAVLYTAALFEFGNLVKPYYEEDTLDITFRSRIRVLDLDLILRPYYGNITPALQELEAKGLHPAISEWILDRFLSDNGLYRAAATACICVIAALIDLNIVVTT